MFIGHYTRVYSYSAFFAWKKGDFMFNIYKKAFPYYKRIYPVLILCIILGLFQGILTLVTPQIISLMVDRVINPAFGKAPVENRSIFMFLVEDIPADNLWQIMLVLVGVLVAFIVAYFITFYVRWNIAHYFSIACDNKLKLSVLNKINSFGPRIMKDYTPGDLITIVNSDCDGIRGFHIANVPFIVDSIFFIIVAMFLLGKINVWLIVAPVATFTLYFFITKGFLKMCEKFYGERWQKNSAFNSETQESIYGIRTIKAYGREDIRRKGFYEKAEQLRDIHMELGRRRQRYFMFFDVTDQIVMVICMAISISLTVNLKMTTGEYAAFLSYMLTMIGYFVDIIFLAGDIQDNKVSCKRLFGLLDKKDEVAELYGDMKMPGRPHIRFENVTVVEGEQTLVYNITLDIPYGKKVGIMGKTGCGKSVLVKTMQGIREYSSGTLTFDGEDSHKYGRGEIAKAFGYAMQDVFLFSNTIESNIAFSNPDASEELIRRCGKAAEVDEFACNFSDGYATVIGEKGFGLSGGQKQRVAIARALLKDAPVLVLDDCTSALDIETESKIFKNLDTFFTGKTIVMTTHRAMALKDFDEIIYMENGRIAERGTFDELIKADGHYAAIYKQQMDKEVYAVE